MRETIYVFGPIVPEEETNVARQAEYAERVRRMNERLNQWRQQIGDDVVDRNPLWFLESRKP